MKKIILALSVISFLALTSISFASVSEKTKAACDQVTGSAQSALGNATGNKDMKAKGNTKQLKGDLRSTKEDVKDNIKNAIN